MNNNDIKKLGTGADESAIDSRTIVFDTAMVGSPLLKGGVSYETTDIEHQHSVGICTAISLTQNRSKETGKKYSADFQYLLQKKYYDAGWFEGSSILNALKVGKKYGFLPATLWTWTTEADRSISYDKYIAKLQAIPDSEIQRLIGLCVDKIAGYAQINVQDPQAIATAINGSKAGILCRYNTGVEWYTNIFGVITWSPAGINPLRAPAVVTSGHAITMSSFDYTNGSMQVLANTWGTDWCKKGCADIDWSNYKMTEAWLILNAAPVVLPFSFKNSLAYSMTSPDIKQLQIILNKNPLTTVARYGAGSVGHETTYFGQLTLIAVKKFQALNHIPTTGFVGTLTRAALNKLL